MKQYVVKVMEKYPHGRYGKEVYETWILSETSKEKAIYFAAEILSGITWHAILHPKYQNLFDSELKMFLPFGCDLYDDIGYNNALDHFSYSAELYKEV